MDPIVLTNTVLVSTCAIMAATLGLAWRMFDRPPHALTWAIAFGCGTLQWSILGHAAWFGYPALAHFATSTLVAAMMTLVTVGARQRAGLPPRFARFAVFGGGIVLAFAYASFVAPDTGLRMGLINGYSAAVLPIAIMAVRPRTRAANPSEIFLVAALAAFAGFMASLGFLAFRMNAADPAYRALIAVGVPPLSIALGVALCFVLSGDLAERLNQLVTRDPLTSALNRRGLEQASEAVIAGARRHRRALTLVAADLDRFKTINDRLGHAAGDRALCRFAEAAHATIRGDDLFARLGGDEFCLLLADANAETAMRVVARIRAAMGEEVTASFGLATLRGTERLEDLIARADEALYRAKEGGRDRAMLEAA